MDHNWIVLSSRIPTYLTIYLTFLGFLDDDDDGYRRQGSEDRQVSWAFCITLHEVMIDELIGDEDRGFLVNDNIPRTCTLTIDEGCDGWMDGYQTVGLAWLGCWGMGDVCNNTNKVVG